MVGPAAAAGGKQRKSTVAAVSLPPIGPGTADSQNPRTAESALPIPRLAPATAGSSASHRHHDDFNATGASAASAPGGQPTTIGSPPPPPLDNAGTLDDTKQRCFDYVFKQRVINRGLIRMIVYAKYGPGVRQPDGSVKLAGAHRLLHPFEEKQLFADEADTFLTDIYGGTLSSTSLTGTRSAVDDESRAAMNRGKNKLALDAMELTRAELQQILANADGLIGANSKVKTVDGKGLADSVKARKRALDEASRTAKSTPTDMAASPVAGSSGVGGAARPGTMKDRFPAAVEDAVSTALLAERRRRIAALKRSEPQRTEVRTDVDVTQRSIRHFYNKTAPKAYTLRSFEDPKDVLRSLHRHSSSIVDPDNRNNVAVTLNVRCLRAEFEPDPDRPGWDGFCCTRASQATKITTLR